MLEAPCPARLPLGAGEDGGGPKPRFGTYNTCSACHESVVSNLLLSSDSTPPNIDKVYVIWAGQSSRLGQFDDDGYEVVWSFFL